MVLKKGMSPSETLLDGKITKNLDVMVLQLRLPAASVVSA